MKIIFMLLCLIQMVSVCHLRADPWEEDTDSVWHCVQKYHAYKNNLQALKLTDEKLADLGVEDKIISSRLMFQYREKMMKWYKKSQILSYKFRNGMPLKEKKDRNFWEWSDVLTHAYYNDHSFTRSLLRFRDFYAANSELQLRLFERTIKILAISHRKKVQSLVRKTLNADI